MISIGELSRLSGIKVATIRYYEQTGLIPKPERSEGNQRRYPLTTENTLSFIKHARQLGFSINEIASLLELSSHPEQSCNSAHLLAKNHLDAVRKKIVRLTRLEKELSRITACKDGKVFDCAVIESIQDHEHCITEHS